MNKVTEKKKRLFAFDALKFTAMLLILNSHFDLLYPEKLRAFATGGSWGNTIFFAVSGYFTNMNDCFFPYLRKKVIRLYPSVIIFTLISLVFHLRDIEIQNVTDVITEFIWPTYYWFVGALVLFYILIYFLEKMNLVSSKFTVFTIVFVGAFLLYYVCLISKKNIWCMEQMGFGEFEGWLKIFSFFYIFALGYYLKKHNGICQKIGIYGSVCLVGFGGIGYMGYKLLLIKSCVPMCFQIFAPVFLNFLALGTLCLVLNCTRNAENERYIGENAEKIVTCLSSLSLEVYLVQFSVIHFFESYSFPLNIVIVVLVVFGLSYLLKSLSFYIVNKVIIK